MDVAKVLPIFSETSSQSTTSNHAQHVSGQVSAQERDGCGLECNTQEKHVSLVARSSRSLSASAGGLGRSVGSPSRLIYFPRGDRVCREKFVRSLFMCPSLELVFLTPEAEQRTAQRALVSPVNRANEKENHRATKYRRLEQPSCTACE